MKHIKLLFNISFALIFVKSLNAQNTYLDSSMYYTYCDAPSLSQGLSFATYSKEALYLDSINSQGEFFTVTYTSKDWKQHNYKYYLRAKDDLVFFTGMLRNENGDSFEVNDLLIYDFSLNVGDTMKISHAVSGLKIELLVDSIKDVKYQDSKLRKTQFYNILSGVTAEYYRVPSPFFTAQGLGSNYGLLPFKLMRRHSPFWQELISVCNKEKVAVYSAIESFNHWNIMDYCNENEIINLIDTIRSLSIGKINFQNNVLFPNPTNNILQLKGISSGNVLIYNSLGQLVIDTKFENQIKISNLPNGLYHIFIHQGNKVFKGDFIKNE